MASTLVVCDTAAEQHGASLKSLAKKIPISNIRLSALSVVDDAECPYDSVRVMRVVSPRRTGVEVPHGVKPSPPPLTHYHNTHPHRARSVSSPSSVQLFWRCAAMGGGPRFPYPKEVWSPSGGWWPYPKNWRTNTVVAFGLLGLLSAPIFIISESKTERAHPPKVRIPWRPNLKPEP